MSAGIAYVPEDRKRDGVFLGLPIRTNITSASLSSISRIGVIARGRDRTIAAKLAGELRVKAPSVETAIRTLSGGNQQKAVLARWLARRPRVLALIQNGLILLGISAYWQQVFSGVIIIVAAVGLNIWRQRRSGG